jgi:hypothetical protein
LEYSVRSVAFGKGFDWTGSGSWLVGLRRDWNRTGRLILFGIRGLGLGVPVRLVFPESSGWWRIRSDRVMVPARIAAVMASAVEEQQHQGHHGAHDEDVHAEAPF